MTDALLNGKTAKIPDLSLLALKSVTFSFNNTADIVMEIFFWVTDAKVYLLQLKQSVIAFHVSENSGQTWEGIWSK